jgi:hypothetical protein
MTATHLLAALAALSLAVPAAAAAAQPDADAQRRAEREQRRAEREQRRFMTAWTIAESDQPLGRRTVNDGDYVLRSRLLPPSLIRLTADAVEPGTNRVIAPAGTQLFGLVSRGAPIWCVAGRRDPGVAERFLLGGGANRQICLVDGNSDGALDGHFSVGNVVKGVPNFSGQLPRELDPLSGGTFETQRPDEIETGYFVGIRFEGMPMVGNRPVFSVTFGTERSRERLTDVIRPRAEEPVVRAMGSEFEIVSRTGEVLEVDVRRNLPVQPFHVVQTVTYR